jgi:hypothetical protein
VQQLKMAVKPNDQFLDRVKKEFQKRLTESTKFVRSKLPGWEESEKLYNCEALPRQHSHESNLIIPKAHYTVETITPQVMSTYFSMSHWLTVQDPQLPDEQLRKQEMWMMWFLMTKMKIYLRTLEAVKGAVSIGTSLQKTYNNNGMPTIDYLNLKNFRPDPRCQKPGEIDSMKWCIELIHNKDFGELERAVVPQTEMVPIEDPISGEVMEGQEQSRVVMAKKYFNLKEVWSELKEMQAKIEEGGDVVGTFNLPSVHLAEMHGEIETKRGVHDLDNNRYEEGKYEEYIVTATCSGPSTDNPTINTIIRCEPSTLKYKDIYQGLNGEDVYLKPYIVWLYNIKPGQFFGEGAIDPIKSLISEQKEHHDLLLDNYKRSINSILSVLQRSGLTDRELEIRPYAKWRVKRHEDVQPVKFPDPNIASFNLLHNLLNQEIDRTTSVGPSMQGIAVSKRQTGQEFRGLAAEQSRKHSMFIQSSSQLSMKPLAFKIMLLMKQMPHIIKRQGFVMPGGPKDGVIISPDELLEQHEMSFAATGVEPEHSIYQKADMFPKLLDKISQSIFQSAQANRMGSPLTINVAEIIGEMETIYNFKDPKRFVMPNQTVVPVQALLSVTPEPYKGIMKATIQQAQQALMQKKEGKPQGRPQGPPQGGQQPPQRR